jgi:DNA polymerase-4
VNPFTVLDHVLIAEAKELLRQLYHEGMEVRLWGVGLSRLIKGYLQLNIFEDMPKWVQLYATLDKIRKKYGEHAIQRGNRDFADHILPRNNPLHNPSGFNKS